MRTLVSRVDRLQRLAVFDAAARLGSFTRAAEDLGMTQPAVTRQIRSLERALDTELFARTANRSELTEAGRRLYNHVAIGFGEIEEGLAELEESTDTFVLASHPGIVQMWLMQRLDALQAVLGEVDLRLWLFERDAELVDGSFDAAIRVGTGHFPGCRSRLLFPEVVVPIAAPSFAEEHGLSESSTAREVRAAPLVHMDDGGRPWMTWSGWLDEFGISLRRHAGRVLFHNYPMVLQQALLGRGVALGWRPLIDEYVSGGALEMVGPEVRSSRGYYVTWPASNGGERVDALVDWLLADPH